MNFLIRKADYGDAAAITYLSNQLGYTITEPATLNNLNTLLQNNNETVFAALHENKVIGWIHVFKTVRLESGAFCEIGGLVVDTFYRGKGAGKQLVKQVKQWCKQDGNHLLRVRSNVKRKEAHQFYQQLGFKETKEQKVFEIDL